MACGDSSPFSLGPVRDEPLQGANGDGVIDVLAVASILARVVAGPAANRREGKGVAHDIESLSELPLRDEGDVALDPYACGAGIPTGRYAFPLDDVEIGDGLGEGLVDGLSLALPLVELAQNLDRAFLRALAAASALRLVDVPRLPRHPDLESAELSVYSHDFGIAEHLDALVPVALDHLGSEDAHGAVVGGEGLVQLGHSPADGGRSLHQIDLKAHVGQVDGRLDAGDAAADYQHRVIIAAHLAPLGH